MKRIYDKEKLEKILKEMKLSGIFTKRAEEIIMLREYDAKEVVINEGEEIISLSIVVKGKFKVVPISTEGKSALISYVGAGDLLGDIEYYSGRESVHTVVADRKSMIIDIPYEVMEMELLEHTTFLNFLAKKLAMKLWESSKAHADNLLHKTKYKIARYLLQESDKKGTEIKIQNVELAQLFGTSDRHVRRIMTELIEEGYIVREKRGYVKILNKDEFKIKIEQM